MTQPSPDKKSSLSEIAKRIRDNIPDTQPGPEDDLPPVPWTVRQFEHAWEIRAADGGLICFVQSEPLARAIAVIPEIQAQIGILKAEIDWHCGELGRLRADNAKLLIALESFSKIDDSEFDRIRELGAERDQLRAEKEELIEILATRTTHPEYMELLRRYKPENKMEE
jgi:hypothetical protein